MAAAAAVVQVSGLAQQRHDATHTTTLDPGARHVHPGGSIQEALEAAANDPVN